MNANLRKKFKAIKTTDELLLLVIEAIEDSGSANAGAIAGIATEVTLNDVNLNVDDLEKGVWAKIPGNSLVIEYYAGIEATTGNFGNPSGSITNAKMLTYRTGGVPVFYQDIAYNINNLATLVTSRV